jgi:protein-L-isoaspartate O-methyltransferase
LSIQDSAGFARWLEALERRHLADLRVPEVTRALRALSSAYVQRRHKVATGATLDSAGKRAAFALFYGPLHFLAVTHVVRQIGADVPPPASILDIGCGTGVAGAAWALSCAGAPSVHGIDRHPWAVEEARRTYGDLGVRGHARVGDLTRLLSIGRGDAIVAAYVLNEVADAARQRLEDQLRQAADRGVRVLIVEPISRRVTPWWLATAARLGARADEWRIPIELPPMLQLLDTAAGLDHRELKLRTLFIDSRRPASR